MFGKKLDNRNKLKELSKKKMKIVHVSDTYYPRTNGVAVYIDSCANYMVSHYHDVIILSPEYPIADNRPSRKNVNIQRYKSYKLFFTTNKDERAVHFSEKKKIYDFLDKENPDVLHIHTEFSLGIIARRWAKKHNKPIIMTCHTYYPPYFKYYMPYLPMGICKGIANKFLKWFYSRADVLITSTKEIEDILKKDCKIKKEISNMFIGIDETDFKDFDKEKEKNEMLKKFPKLKNKKVLLFVGRIAKEKNIDFLLEAMKNILDTRDNDVELLLVGGGNGINRYRGMSKDLGIEKHTTFLDAVSHSDIRKYYALADVFVFPSVTETQGLVTTEALYLGIPVVALNALGNKTVLKGEKGGFLVEEDIDKFTEKVNLLLDNEEIYNQKRQEALDRGKSLSFSNNFNIFQ